MYTKLVWIYFEHGLMILLHFKKSIAGREKISTKMGFEPTRAEPIGLAVQRLNHSATSSDRDFKYKTLSRYIMLASLLNV